MRDGASRASERAQVAGEAVIAAAATAGRELYEHLRSNAIAALEAGRLREARERLDEAWQWAAGEGDVDLTDRATCNLAAVDLALGDLERPLPELRRILIGNRSAENCFLAAYNMARALELRKEHKKGLFYARIAQDRARQLGRAEWIYGAGNQAANFLVAESRFAEAAAEYRRALDSLPAAEREGRVEAIVNLGYCELMLGRPGRSLELLYAGLRTARRRGLVRSEMIARLDLALALLETGRCETAHRHVELGLAMAEASGEADMVKNGLFLAGEVEIARGEEAAAHARYRELQERFYPGQPLVAQWLGAVDVRPLLNLRA